MIPCYGYVMKVFKKIFKLKNRVWWLCFEIKYFYKKEVHKFKFALWPNEARKVMVDTFTKEIGENITNDLVDILMKLIFS